MEICLLMLLKIDDLSMIENLLNQCKDYIKSNIPLTTGNTYSTPNIIKINCNNNSNIILKKRINN